jgi:PAS domain S-box-containing protein
MPKSALSLRQAGIAALGMAFLSLLVILFLSERNWRELESSNREAIATARILNLNTGVLGAVRDAETGERGYLLTGRAEYLQSYNAAVGQVPGEIRELISLVRAHSASQLQRAEQLQTLVNENIEQMRKTIAARASSGLQSAEEMVEIGRGKQLTDRTRVLATEIETEEFQRWRASSASVETDAREARFVTLAGVAVLAFFLFGAFAANQRWESARERLIGQLAAANRSTTEMRDLLRTTLYSIGEAVITTDGSGAVRLMNSVAERLTGFSEAEARGLPIETVFRTVGEGPTARNPAAPLRVVSRGGSEFPVIVNESPIQDERGTPHGRVLVFRDITGLRRGEERLREAAKLESLGVLAGGIAHDFNNLLVGILGNASLLREHVDPASPAAGLLDELERAGERAAQLTGQMLAYSGRGRFVVRPLDVSREIEQIVNLLHAAMPKGVKLRLSLGSGLPLTEADSTQIQQLAMNLAINAGEAVQSGEGTVEISTCCEVVAEAAAGEGPAPRDALGDAIEPGEYVVLSVRDTGVGMDEATRARIFEPFFSTKFTGRGLGLSAVLGIVKGHGGGIEVDSAPGRGTTIRVYLPVARTRRRVSA